MGSRCRRGAVIAALFCLAALAPAQAGAAVGAPISIGTGRTPNVTLDSAGTAHIVWQGQGSNSKVLTYCRLPRGATACSPQTVVPAEGDGLDLPIAFAAGTTTRVISHRFGLTGPSFEAVMLYTSADGGATFDAGTPIGTVKPRDYAFGPGDTVSVLGGTTGCSACYQALPFSGAAASGPAELSSTHPYPVAVAMIDPNTPLALFATAGGDTQFRRYGGSGDVNDQANWAPPVDIGNLDWMWSRLASGPNGVFLITQDTNGGGTMQARKFDGTAFVAPAAITTGTRADHVAEDGAGRLHVVASKFSSGQTGTSLFYASSDDGSRWDTDAVDFPGVPGEMRVAVADDHFGVVAGSYGSASGTTIFASAIGPSAAVPTTSKFVDATVVSGTVLIQVPPSKKFVRLRLGDVIPVGSVVDATNGRVRITVALPNGRLQSADFFSGAFKVTQAKAGASTMVLTGGSFATCGRGARTGALAAKAKVVRHLWASGTSGDFRTKAKYAAAAKRGTTWDTIDRCDGTLIRVTQGRVLVTDLKTNRKITVKAGRSYLAKA